MHSPARGAVPETADMLAVGLVTATHGVAGELKVRSFSGESGHIVALREALFRKGRAEERLRIQSARSQVSGAIIRIEGMESPEKARRLVGYELWVPRASAAPRAEGEYYAADLCRCSIWFGDRCIGAVHSVWDAGPTPMLEVRAPGGKTFLVPFTDHFVGEVDLEEGSIALREDEIVR